VRGIQGIFCGNFDCYRGNWTPCRKAWCGECYTQHPNDNFHVHTPQDEEGFVWQKQGDENRFTCGRDGDHLVTPFQCDLCIFRLLKGRDPRPTSHQDGYLQCCIRQMNLDALWISESSTVNGHRSAFKLGMRILQDMGIPPPYPHMGPYPMEDTFGYTIAIQMLLKSLEPGNRGREYQQFVMIKKLRSAYSGVYYASARGVAEGASYGKGRNQSFYMRCPTDSPWFIKFYNGCKKWMGKDLDANVALSGDGVRECLREILQAAQAEGDDRVQKHYLCVGAYVAITYTASLRGHETFFMDLAGVRRYLSTGLAHRTQPHVVAALMGRFKGETGEKYHLIPLPVVTNSGIKVGQWMEALFAIRAAEGRYNGPAFCDEDGGVARSRDFEATFIEMLERVQARRPDVFAPGERISKTHGISRSLWKGSNTEAKAANISQPDIDAMNRWRKVERAAGRQPSFNMHEHYSEVRMMLRTLLCYPQAL